MFKFSENWINYSNKAATPERIEVAREDFKRLTEGISIESQRFIDIGFGQGLSLLLAKESGAKVIGVDIDKDNQIALEKTHELFPNLELPETHIGSIIDPEFVAGIKKLGPFDIVHSWGVLHHTGDMHKAIDHSCQLIKPGGHFILAIYNKHFTAYIWLLIKYLYNIFPGFMKKIFIAFLAPPLMLRNIILEKNINRGMDTFYNAIDWIGGYPYEFESVEGIIEYVEKLGPKCIKSTHTLGYTGCNEFIFKMPDS